MMYNWTDSMISFMDEASSCSVYFAELADLIEPFLCGCRTICDAGCGIGQLSAELGKRGYNVYACDVSEKAVSFIKNRNYKNVIPVNCNLDSYNPEQKIDAAIFNYFGSTEQIIEIAERLGLSKFVIIKKNYSFHRFSFSQIPIVGHSQIKTEVFLSSRKIKYSKCEFESQLGQPFRSIDDAICFFNLYSRDCDRSIINEENVVKRLERNVIPGYEYYLPHSKRSLVFFVEK